MLIIVLVSAPAAAERLALVVGNAAYTRVTPLDNTVHDATDMAAALETLGFRVLLHTDVTTRSTFKDILRQFRSELARDPTNIGLFFYAGHAVQVEGENYLIPVDGDIRDKPDLERESLSLGYVTAMAEDAGNQMNLFFIDACRDNPFRGFSRSVRRGLAPADTPQGSLITFAASPGSTASDGDGRNSPFTTNLLREIDSDQHILLMLQNVVKGVREDTAGAQQPWFHSSLTGDFYFNPASGPASTDNASELSKSSSATDESDITNSAVTTLSSANPPRTTDNQLPAARNTLQGRWSGQAIRQGSPEESIKVTLRATGNGNYAVNIDSLISFGTLPALCSLAHGTLVAETSAAYRLTLDHPGCRVSGTLALKADKLSGTIDIAGRPALLQLSH